MQKKGYKDLILWQKSMQLVVVTYKLVNLFPKDELYGLTSQIKRSAISIPSNVAEGSKRRSKKDFRHFLIIAFGSGAELETQIELAKRLHFASLYDYKEIDALLEECMKMLNKIIHNMLITKD